MWLGAVLLVSAATAQRFGSSQQRGGVQTLQSVPLPPRGYVSPSVLRQQTEAPKPFAFKYEAPDAYGGFSSHESQGDETGRITGKYTVQNPDGTSRLVRYVADPETGFHAEVETDEEGTETSEPANASIVSTAPREGYQAPTRNAPVARSPASFSNTAFRASRTATRTAPARFANSLYQSPQATYRAPLQPAGAFRRSLRNTALNQASAYNTQSAIYNNYNDNRSSFYRGLQSTYTAPQRTGRTPAFHPNYLRATTEPNRYLSQNSFAARRHFN